METDSVSVSRTRSRRRAWVAAPRLEERPCLPMRHSPRHQPLDDLLLELRVGHIGKFVGLTDLSFC